MAKAVIEIWTGDIWIIERWRRRYENWCSYGNGSAGQEVDAGNGNGAQGRGDGAWM